MFGTTNTSISIRAIRNCLLGLAWASLFYFSSCNSEQSGPCEWAVSRVEAEVIAINPQGTNQEGDSLFQVLVKFDGSSYSNETQDLGELRDINFTRELLTKNRIRLGNRYKSTVSETTSGNCQSPILSFDAKLRR